EFRPGVAAVARGEQPAARPAAGQAPGRASCLPCAGEQHLRRLRVEGDVGGAAVLVAEENTLPGLSAVGGAVTPAFLVAPARPADTRPTKIRVKREWKITLPMMALPLSVREGKSPLRRTVANPRPLQNPRRATQGHGAGGPPSSSNCWRRSRQAAASSQRS